MKSLNWRSGYRGVVLFLIATNFTFLLTECASKKNAQIVIKFSSVIPPSNPIMLTYNFIADEIEKRSNGEITVKIYDSGRIGGETDSVERLLLGTLEMADMATSVLGNLVEDFFVFDLPFLFDNTEQQYNILQGDVGKKLNRKLEQTGLKVLAYYGTGARSIYTKEPVQKIEDLKGIKLRVMESNVMIQTINALGAHAVPLSFSELYNALQQDVVEGAENLPFQYLATGHYDICPNYVLTEHFMVPQVILMPLSFYNRLSDEHKLILDDVLKDSQEFHKKNWSRLENKALEKLRQEGVEITEVDKAPFRKRVENVYHDFEIRYGNEFLREIRE